MSEPLQPLLTPIVGAQHVSAAAADLASYSPAGAPPPGDVVVWPGSAGEIAQVLKVAREHGAALLAVRRGTRRRAVGSIRPGTASRPGRPTILVDQRRMTSVLQLDETSLVAHAQAGITARALEELLGRRGLTLGFFPQETFTLPLGALLARRRMPRRTTTSAAPGPRATSSTWAISPADAGQTTTSPGGVVVAGA